MKKLFAQFLSLLNKSNVQNAMKLAWTLAKMQGAKSVTFKKVTDKFKTVTRESFNGVFTPSLTKDKSIVVLFMEDEQTFKSFRLEELISFE